ncbi:cysteine desulfurase family protein [Olivibacter domesticus]|uniref:cysteine desulfurase n=1 Tax=Olivibacter domesticus TaxID=407022 RepID=A0A1H7MCL3_OLID1|nr:cysteine desulfurase family protein [Olivibacter domesticus]SEL09070.1 cysteine desulfurase [Olivibacter domesticus]
MTSSPRYLDYCATTPCDPDVVQSMLPYFTEHFGNAASRDHNFGWLALDAVEIAREQIAHLIQAASKEIVFTSGATESINLALKGLVDASESSTNHIITSKVEHQAVLDTCAYLEKKGYSITYLDVDEYGLISLEALEDAIQEKTLCIALMYGNNETGVLNPVREIGHIARKYGVCFFCDATQAVGKVDVNVNEAEIDLMSFSAHKMYGPKGVGALFVRRNLPMSKISRQQHGGDHERGSRSGTLNVPGIVGFGKAAEICSKKMRAESAFLQHLRDTLETMLLSKIPSACINGGKNRLPHITNVLFPSVDAELLLLATSKHLALSRGSACSGITQKPSHVLQGMGLTDELARNAIRISLGRFTKEEDIMYAVEILSNAVSAMEIKNKDIRSVLIGNTID